MKRLIKSIIYFLMISDHVHTSENPLLPTVKEVALLCSTVVLPRWSGEMDKSDNSGREWRERYTCPHPSCNRVFVYYGSFRKHIRSIHREKPPLERPVMPCSKMREKKDPLQRHIQRKLPDPMKQSDTRDNSKQLLGAEQYLCMSCCRGFHDGDALKKHRELWHTNPYLKKCPQCHFIHWNKDALDNHTKSHADSLSNV